MSQTEFPMYRLRCASPMPIQGRGSFVLHTFGVEYLINRNYICSSYIPNSTSFRGQGGDLMSANFTRMDTKEELYQGREVVDPGPGERFKDEGVLPYSL